MKFILRKNFIKEYECELTDELDELAGLNKDTIFHHYILADEFCINRKCLAIRVPGGTIGGLHIDDRNIITKIKIDTNYIIKSYPENINDIMKKYIGQTIEYQI